MWEMRGRRVEQPHRRNSTLGQLDQGTFGVIIGRNDLIWSVGDCVLGTRGCRALVTILGSSWAGRSASVWTSVSILLGSKDSGSGWGPIRHNPTGRVPWYPCIVGHG